MPLQARVEIDRLPACHHGGPDYTELIAKGIEPEQLLDFSTCCNPYRIPETTRKGLQDVNFSRYPDSESLQLRCRLSQKLGVKPSNILAGNGTTELFRLISLTYFRNKDKILIFQPTYGEYEIASHLMGAEVIKYKGIEASNFSLEPQILCEIIRRIQPRALFICNPNNPTGQYLTKMEITQILKYLGDGLLVLDEAYISFVNKAWSSLELLNRYNVIILRSMTKDYALPGLRLGYAVAMDSIIDTLSRVKPPWNVNAMAQKAGLMILEQDNYFNDSLKKISKGTEFLVDKLRGLNLNPIPSKTHFFLVKVGNGKFFREALIKQGILVRECSSFELDNYIRIAPRSMTDCKKFIRALIYLKGLGSGNGWYE